MFRKQVDSSDEGFTVGGLSTGADVGKADTTLYEVESVGCNEVDGADEDFLVTEFEAGTVVGEADVVVYAEELNTVDVMLDDK